jgi:hypothetical protein
MICDQCGVSIAIGDWPFCPHGPARVTVISDSIPGGLVIENLGPEPVRVYSETERRRIMKERGLVEFVRHRPPPGTDKSVHTSNWSAVTQQMLDDAADLVSGERRRCSDAEDQDPDAQLESFSMTVTERESGFRVRPDGEPRGD